MSFINDLSTCLPKVIATSDWYLGAMADLGDQERTIHGEAKECRNLFTDTMVHLSQHDPLSIGVELQDELGRFNLWAGNIGVFAPLQASLDFRLIDVPDIRSQFLRQLDTLIITLLQLNEAATQATTEENERAHGEDATAAADASRLSDHDIVDMVQSIHVTIDWLHRLSNLVRKASFGSQNQRAAKFPLVDEAGNNITESLADIFKHLVKRECCDISDQILNRLIQTMITRRRRVLYRRSRQNRWALQQEAYRPQNLDPPAQLAPSQEADESGEVQEGSVEAEEVESKPENRAQTTLSKLTVTTLNQQEYRKLAAPSRISRATTAPFQHNEKLLVPPPPSLAKEANEFVCDYCCLILPSSEAAGQDTWANHVKRDLDPYICVFDDCSQPYQIYSSSKEWLSHMRSEHRMSWRCVVRDHPPQTFQTREDFLNHMTEAHPGRFRKEQLPFVAESSARALNPTIPACPFCAEESGDLENHVAQHLCHFALQSLPWPEHLDQTSEIISGQKTNSSTSEDDERETLNDDLHDLNDGFGLIDDELLHFLELELETVPFLDTPVSWPSIGRVFPETDQVLSEFAAHAATLAKMAPKDNYAAPKTLDEEVRQVREQFPDILWNEADMNTRLLHASLQGPWGADGENVVLKVRIDIPRAYPKAQAPRFHIEKDTRMPEWIHGKLQREVHQICHKYLRRKEACLAAIFSYLLGQHDLNSGIGESNSAETRSNLLETVEESPPSPVLPVPGPDAMGLPILFSDDIEAIEPDEVKFQPKAGYLTKRGENFGAWKSRFCVIDGPQLKYYDAEGGAQLGSIELHGAQIGKQQRQDDTSSAVDNQYNHAMLIQEAKKGSSTIKHVLCAESDEERDLWVEALLPWVNYAEPQERAKTAERDRPGVSESQTGTFQPSTFDVLKYGNSDHFLSVQYLGHYTEIASATIADCPIICLLDHSRTEFGTFEGLPAGIIYMDIIIDATYKNLKNVTITVVLDDKDPDLQQAVRGASADLSGSLDRPVTLTSFYVYGPRNMVTKRSKDAQTANLHSHHEAEAMGTSLGGIGPGQNTTWSSREGWMILNRLPPSSRSVCWDIPLPDGRPIHTGFVFQGGGQPFSLKVEIKGKCAKISDRIREASIQLTKSSRNSSKQDKVILNHSNRKLHRPLDELARALPEALVRKNELRVPLQRTGARPVISVDMRSGHFVGAEATFDPRIKGTRSHDFDTPRLRFQPRENVDTDEGKVTVLPRAPLQSSATLEGLDLVDESPNMIGDDRDDEPQGSQAHETVVEELEHERMDGLQERSNDDFLHEDSHVAKTPISGSNLRSGEQAPSSMIPRYAGKRDDTKTSNLARHFEQLSRDFERERIRDRKQRTARTQPSREFLPQNLAKAIVEVYTDSEEPALERGPSYRDNSGAGGRTFNKVEEDPAKKQETATVTFADTVKSRNAAESKDEFSPDSGPRDTDTAPEWPSLPRMRRASQKVAPRLPRAQTLKRQQDDFRDRFEHVQPSRTEENTASIGRELHDYQRDFNSSAPPTSMLELEGTDERSLSTSSNPEERPTGNPDHHWSQ